MSLSLADRDAYLRRVRQMLGELSQRRQHSEVFSQLSDEQRNSLRASFWSWFTIHSASANACPDGTEEVTFTVGGRDLKICRVRSSSADVSGCLSRPGTVIVNHVGRVDGQFYGAHCVLAADDERLANLRDRGVATESGPHSGSAYRADGQVLPPESRPARAPAARTEINPANADIHEACQASEASTPARLQVFRLHSRQNGGICLHGGNLTRYGGTSGDFNASSVRAGNCRGRSSFEVSGFRVQCANSRQTLCNPLIYGLASVSQDETEGSRQAVGRCVPRSANATKTCDDRFGQAQDGESAAQFLSRSVPGLREAYEDFRRNLASFCNTPVSREAHCEECRVLRDRISAANREVRPTPASPGSEPGAGAPGAGAPGGARVSQ